MGHRARLSITYFTLYLGRLPMVIHFTDEEKCPRLRLGSNQPGISPGQGDVLLHGRSKEVLMPSRGLGSLPCSVPGWTRKPQGAYSHPAASSLKQNLKQSPEWGAADGCIHIHMHTHTHTNTYTHVQIRHLDLALATPSPLDPVWEFPFHPPDITKQEEPKGAFV